MSGPVNATLAVLGLLWWVGAASASPPPAAGELVIDVHHVLLPCPDVPAVESGRVEYSAVAGSYALGIDVRPADPQRGWILWMRATEPHFQSADGNKPCHDLLWKADADDGGAYRPVTDQEVAVCERPAGGGATVRLDFLTAVDWATAPGTYRLNVAFRLQAVE